LPVEITFFHRWELHGKRNIDNSAKRELKLVKLSKMAQLVNLRLSETIRTSIKHGSINHWTNNIVIKTFYEKNALQQALVGFGVINVFSIPNGGRMWFRYTVCPPKKYPYNNRIISIEGSFFWDTLYIYAHIHL
jgi:hypothetical protein